ncbi:MAG: hypothetical protein AB4426_13475 [Xenococcaceae cyanobacterium]
MRTNSLASLKVKSQKSKVKRAIHLSGDSNQKGTSDQATGNRQQVIGNRQQATGNRQQATGNRQQGTGNRERDYYSSSIKGCESKRYSKGNFGSGDRG